MHSRVFQISKSPILKVNHISSDSLPEWFFYDLADSVSETDEPEEDIKWLLECNRGVFFPGVDPSSLVLLHGAKRLYFKDRFQRFKENVALLSTLSFEAFIGNENWPQERTADYLMYLLQTSYEDRCGFFFYTEDDELLSIDKWMRQAEEGKTYYLGGILDYHF